MSKKKLITLFFSTLYLSAFTFGGGYVIVTLMRKKFVSEYHWIDEDEMLDLIAIAQSSPGAIAVNGAIVVGYKLAGIAGIIVSVIATIIPPFVVISFISFCYEIFRTNIIIALILEGMQAGVGAVIVAVVFEMAAGIIHEKNIFSLFIMISSFILTYFFNINVIYIIFICIMIGLIKTFSMERTCKIMILLQLFLSFLQIGAFSFGGGYAAMPLIQNQVVELHHWLTIPEFTDLITISQMTPGPIAINSATFVGIKIAGLPGAIIATLGCILPSCLIVTIIAWLYLKFRQMESLQSILNVLRPAVVALIASAGFTIIITAFFGELGIAVETLKIQMVVIFVICLFLLMKWKMNPIFVMILAGLLNVLQYFLIQPLL